MKIAEMKIADMAQRMGAEATEAEADAMIDWLLDRDHDDIDEVPEAVWKEGLAAAVRIAGIEESGDNWFAPSEETRWAARRKGIYVRIFADGSEEQYLSHEPDPLELCIDWGGWQIWSKDEDDELDTLLLEGDAAPVSLEDLEKAFEARRAAVEARDAAAARKAAGAAGYTRFSVTPVWLVHHDEEFSSEADALEYIDEMDDGRRAQLAHLGDLKPAPLLRLRLENADSHLIAPNWLAPQWCQENSVDALLAENLDWVKGLASVDDLEDEEAA